MGGRLCRVCLEGVDRMDFGLHLCEVLRWMMGAGLLGLVSFRIAPYAEAAYGVILWM